MNIAFWSNVRHQSGVTSSVAVISVLWVELFVEKIAVTSNHISNGSLVKRLYGGSEHEEKIARKAYSYTVGEPEYFRQLYSGKIKTTLCLNDSLRFIPMWGGGEELFENIGLDGINGETKGSDHLLVDTACGCGLCSQKILEDAEVTVILFPPDRVYIDAFFQSEPYFRDNSFFILGNYHQTSSCQPAYLTRRYQIPTERIGVIPYNLGLEQAMREGNTIAYIAGNMHCSRSNSAYRFIYYATKTVKRLREYVLSRR